MDSPDVSVDESRSSSSDRHISADVFDEESLPDYTSNTVPNDDPFQSESPPLSVKANGILNSDGHTASRVFDQQVLPDYSSMSMVPQRETITDVESTTSTDESSPMSDDYKREKFLKVSLLFNSFILFTSNLSNTLCL